MKFSEHNGAIIDSRRAGEFQLTEIIHASKAELPRHSHQKACFCFVLKGAYTEIFREKSLECQSADLIFRPAGEIHSDRFGETNTRCFIVEFENKWLEKFDYKWLKSDEPNCLQSDSLAWLAMRIRNEARHSDDFTPLTVEGLMFELIAEVARKKVDSFEQKQPRWLKEAREILHENFAVRISLAEIARQVGVHPVYLAETFRRHYRCTIGEYLRRLRIEFASRQISETDDALADIAIVSGFAHQAHFSRTFKRLTGQTPAQFRENSRRKS